MEGGPSIFFHEKSLPDDEMIFTAYLPSPSFKWLHFGPAMSFRFISFESSRLTEADSAM